MAAAHTLAEQVTEDDLQQGSLYPPLKNIRDVSAHIAAAVAAVAYRRELARGPAARGPARIHEVADVRTPLCHVRRGLTKTQCRRNAAQKCARKVKHDEGDCSGDAPPPSVCGGVRAQARRKLATLANESRFDRDQILFREGDECSEFYLIVTGLVALEIAAPGHTFRVQTLVRGRRVGLVRAVDGQGKHFQARTLERVDALAFEGTELLAACREDTLFGFVLMQRLLGVVAERLAGDAAAIAGHVLSGGGTGGSVTVVSLIGQPGRLCQLRRLGLSISVSVAADAPTAPGCASAKATRRMMAAPRVQRSPGVVAVSRSTALPRTTNGEATSAWQSSVATESTTAVRVPGRDSHFAAPRWTPTR